MTATERVDLEPAWVLHGRPYRETSELVELFTHSHGRVSVLAKGMRRPKAGLRGMLQPFRPLLVSWSGRGGGLMTLRAAESAGPEHNLQGAACMAGFYVNELVLRFLHRGDPHPELHGVYAGTLAALAASAAHELPLRRFEIALLAESGYGLNLDQDAASGGPIDPDRRYEYAVERGPVPAEEAAPAGATYAGAELIAIARGEFADEWHLRCARRLLRRVLDHHLGGKPLRTREVFAAMKR